MELSGTDLGTQVREDGGVESSRGSADPEARGLRSGRLGCQGAVMLCGETLDSGSHG